MKAMRWMLLACAVAGATAAVAAVSCAVDDEVVWISGAACTDGERCSRTEPDDYACDVDLTCTPGCATDWDCDEGTALAGGDADADGADVSRDTGADGSPADATYDAPGPDVEAGVDDDAWDRDDIGDAGDSGFADDDGNGGETGCVPEGGGATPETAQTITLGTGLPGLLSCPTTSSWFRFDLAAGTDFVVRVSPRDGVVTFRIYAGTELAVLDEAAMDGDAGFSARAGATGAYFVRVRAEGADPVLYDLTLASPTEPR